MSYDVPFNRPFIAGKELYYIAQAVTLGNIGGDGQFTEGCSRLLEREFEIHRVLMTPSCTAALEIAALLCGLKDGDEVLMPSFTFVSTANAVVRTGARPVFVDVRPDTLNLDEALLREAIGPRTQAIFPVHYGGVACEMDAILAIAREHGVTVVEDAAQGVNAWYKGRALGSIGQLGTFSFHETKSYISGEGGALCVNDPLMLERAQIIRDKGTDRQRFLRGEVRKYRWVDIGSSYTPSELVSAFLFGQLEMMQQITSRRREAFAFYDEQLAELEHDGLLRRPRVPGNCRTNHHLFYILLPDQETRDSLIRALAQRGIQAISHFEPLHTSPFGQRYWSPTRRLPVTESVAPRLLRLPLFHDITTAQQELVVTAVREHLQSGAERRSSVSAVMGPRAIESTS